MNLYLLLATILAQEPSTAVLTQAEVIQEKRTVIDGVTISSTETLLDIGHGKKAWLSRTSMNFDPVVADIDGPNMKPRMRILAPFSRVILSGSASPSIS